MSDQSQQKSPSQIKRVFRAIYMSIFSFFAMMGFLIVGVPIIALILFSLGGGDNRDISESSSKPIPPLLLEVTLEGSLIEQPPGLEEQILSRFFGGSHDSSMAALRSMFRRAKKDDDVKGVVVKLGSLSASPDQYAELRSLMANFRESKKKLVLWMASADTYSYFLASAADEIYLAPGGSMAVTGPVIQLTYLADLLKKIGVQFEVIRAGKYKSAFEALVENEPSQATLEMYQSMEVSIRQFLLEEIASGRGATVEQVSEWLKQSLFTPQDALRKGLVDKLDFYDVALSQTKEAFKSSGEDVTTVDPKDYLNSSDDVETEITVESSEGIGLIYATGNIVSSSDKNASEVITPDLMNEQIEWAMEDDDVKAVVLRINSPGGSATASDIIWHDLKRLAATKPLIVSMGPVVASGGYYMAVAGNRIIAETVTITGSIGVIGAVPNFEAFKEKYGVHFYVITNSDRAKLLNPGEASSAFDRAIVENNIEVAYQLFLSRVAEGRKLKVEEVHALAQGRVYTGLQAAELGLVDELGSMEAAFAAAKEMSGLDPQKLYKLHRYTGKETDLSECLTGAANMIKCLRKFKSSTLLHAFAKRQALPFLPEVIGRRLWHAFSSEERLYALWVQGLFY